MIAAVAKQWFANLHCRLTGHRRGKRISTTHVRCPRCKHESERAERKKVSE